MQELGSSSLTILIGIPRCGKSTYCKKWEREKVGRIVVSEDDIHLALHGRRYSRSAESTVKNMAELMTKVYLDRGFEVLLDDTHTSQLNLYKRLLLDPYANIKIFFNKPIDIRNVQIPTEKEWAEYIKVSKERAIRTAQEDLLPVIDRHAEQMLYILCNLDVINDLRERALLDCKK